MRTLFLPFAALALSCLALPAQAPAPSASKSRQELAVLYAGVLQTERTTCWMQFLDEHFKKADAIALETLSTTMAADYDVVLVDAPSPFQGERDFKMPKAPQLDDGYTTPTILIGAAGGALINSKKGQLKLDWF